MADEEIMYDVKDYVATITINRPKTLNAFTGDNIVEMERLILEATTDKKVGVIVLTGAGERAFCVGGDVNWEKDAGGKSGLEGLKFNFNRHIVECPKPVIARVNGYAIGGGHHIAYFCDFTVAAEHAIFGQNGPRVGSPAGGYIVSHSAGVTVIEWAREHGAERVSLNFAAFARVLEAPPGADRVTRLQQRALAHLGSRFQLERLLAFSAKFADAWEPRYAAYPSRAALLRVGVAAMAAEAYLALPGHARLAA